LSKRSPAALKRAAETRTAKKQREHEREQKALETVKSTLDKPEALIFLLSAIAGAGIAYPLEVEQIEERDARRVSLQDMTRPVGQQYGNRIIGSFKFEVKGVFREVQQHVPLLGEISVPIPRHIWLYIDTGDVWAGSFSEAWYLASEVRRQQALQQVRMSYPLLGLAVGAVLSAFLYTTAKALEIQSVSVGDLPSLTFGGIV